MSEQSTLLAAQPIYDRKDKVYAVELLYRNDLQQSAMEVGEARATSELIFNLCTGITEQAEHYHSPAFINVSADFLQSRSFLPIDPDKVVIELVERMAPTPELVRAVADWHRAGFRFALDDFEFTEDWDALLPYASVIKVDILTVTAEQAEAHRHRLAHLDCLWLAERVEDQAIRNTYMDLGFDLFQGYFYAKPSVVYGRKLNPAAIQLARLLAVLFSDSPDIDEMDELISADPGLAVSLLKIINSPMYRAGSRITSVRGVIIRLGIQNLRRWVALVGCLNAASAGVARLVLTRAQLCYELSARTRTDLDPAQAFLVGLLSGADILLQVDRDSFIEQLAVSDEIKAAVRSHEGGLGRTLRVALNLEQSIQMKRRLDTIDTRLLKIYRKASDSVQTMMGSG